MLALNTTLRASSVTGSKADMSRLSDEVTQLSELLSVTTKEVGTLAKSVLQDADDTARIMENACTELSTFVLNTADVDAVFQQAQSDMQNVQRSLSSHMQKTVDQSVLVSQLVEEMDVINHYTKQIADGIVVSTSTRTKLQELVAEHRNCISSFRLPAKPSAFDPAALDPAPLDSDTAQSSEHTDRLTQARKAANRAVLSD